MKKREIQALALVPITTRLPKEICLKALENCDIVLIDGNDDNPERSSLLAFFADPDPAQLSELKALGVPMDDEIDPTIYVELRNLPRRRIIEFSHTVICRWSELELTGRQYRQLRNARKCVEDYLRVVPLSGKPQSNR